MLFYHHHHRQYHYTINIVDINCTTLTIPVIIIPYFNISLLIRIIILQLLLLF